MENSDKSIRRTWRIIQDILKEPSISTVMRTVAEKGLQTSHQLENLNEGLLRMATRQNILLKASRIF